ncbi:glycoside hydrolase family 51 protein [Mycena floridula]|nr:glycoside hydrolase family 51 protein [Mycena floridula]
MLGISTLFILAAARLVSAATFSVTVSGTASHPVPSTLYGLMYEDISSGDGGLYAELLQNRAFQQVSPGTSAALNAWAALGSTSHISVVRSSTPVSSALPNSLSLAVSAGTTGNVGFSNSGYFGINVNASWTYTGSFWYRFPTTPSTTISGSFNVGLQTTGGTVLVTKAVAFTSSAGWKQVTFTLQPTSTQSAVTNLFTVSVNGATVSGQTIEFAMFSLFPPTFKNRANGMRMDLSQTLLDMKPAFFRFPGGNNLEGGNTASRWQWNTTVGPLLSRPGRQGDWGYVNTDGLGLFEYLQWIEDMGMESIMAVWAGYSLDGNALPASSLPPYIQQAADQINFAIGDPSQSAAAALRSSLGHPAPFAVKYIEIGNEDNFAASSYASYRWADYYNTLSGMFPQLTFIATSATSGVVPSITPAPKAWDLHIYSNPNFFRSGCYNFDILPRNTGLKFFQGEYAATTSDSGATLPYPSIDGSVAEAAYLTGFDRNSDIVFAASYAPLLNHISSSQWSPNLISFSPNTVIRSTSYYVQQMFSLYKGDTYFNSTTNSASSAVQWSVTKNTAGSLVYLKAINTATTANTVVFTLPFTILSTAGTGTVLTAATNTMNTPSNPNAAVPRAITFTAGKTITYNAPGLSASVLIVSAR